MEYLRIIFSQILLFIFLGLRTTKFRLDLVLFRDRKQVYPAPLRCLRVLDEMKLCHPDLAQNPGKLSRRNGQDGESVPRARQCVC